MTLPIRLRRTIGLLASSTLIACSAAESSGGPDRRNRPAETPAASRDAAQPVRFEAVDFGSGRWWEGVVLQRTGDNPAIYRLTGSEAYVRVKVTDSGGPVAWLQPVFVTR